MGCLLHTPLFIAGCTVLALSFGLYFFLQLLCGTFYKTQNLKRRYNASWALVTGSSSGARERARDPARRGVGGRAFAPHCRSQRSGARTTRRVW